MRSRGVQSLCLLVSMACLGLAYILAGRWLILVVLAGMVLFWLYFRKRSTFGSASILLFAFISLAAVGVLLDLSLPLLIVGCTAALAAWDLSLFFHAGPGGSLPPDASMEKDHLGWLVTACGIGLPLAFISSALDFQIPFGLMIFLALLAVVGLIRGARRLQKSPLR